MSGTTAYKGRVGTHQISANGGSTFTTVGGVRVTNVTINNNPADISNVGSGGFREMLADAGNQGVDISLEGVVVDDTAFETLVTQAHDRTMIYHRFTFASSGTITGQFVIGTFGYGAPHDGAQTFTASLMSSGTVAFVEPT
jgi:predicted secreted protein